MIYLGSCVNDTKRIHCTIINKNKNIISNFKRMKDAYFYTNSMKTENFIYNEGVKLLKK